MFELRLVVLFLLLLHFGSAGPAVGVLDAAQSVQFGYHLAHYARYLHQIYNGEAASCERDGGGLLVNEQPLGGPGVVFVALLHADVDYELWVFNDFNVVSLIFDHKLLILYKDWVLNILSAIISLTSVSEVSACSPGTLRRITPPLALSNSHSSSRWEGRVVKSI